MHRASANGVATVEKRELEPPKNHGAEQDILGAAFRDKEVAEYISKELSRDYFDSPKHREVFAAVQSIVMNGGDIDVITVAEELKAMGVLAQIDGARTLSEIASSITAAGWKQKVNILREKYVLRQFRLAGMDLLSESAEQSGPAHEAIDGFIDRLKDLKRIASGQADHDTFQMLTGPELDATDVTVEYLIDGILAKGQPQIIGAPEKCCKTLISTDMAISLCTGKPFLGAFTVSGTHNVGFMTGESGLGTIKDNTRAICRAKGISPSDLVNLHLSEHVPDMSRREELDRLSRTIKHYGISVLIVDPAFQMMGKDVEAGNLISVGHLLRGLNEVCQEHGVTVVINHHLNKRIEQAQTPNLSHLTWAGWREWTRQWVLLNRLADFDPEDGKHSLIASIGGSAGHSGNYHVEIQEGKRNDPARKVRFSIKPASLAKKQNKQKQAEAKAQEYRATIMNLLKTHPNGKDGLTNSVIQSETGLNGTTVAATVDSLIIRGSVECLEVKIKGVARQAIRISQSQSESVNTSNDGCHQNISHQSHAYKGVTDVTGGCLDWEVPSKAEDF